MELWSAWTSATEVGCVAAKASYSAMGRGVSTILVNQSDMAAALVTRSYVYEGATHGCRVGWFSYPRRMCLQLFGKPVADEHHMSDYDKASLQELRVMSGRRLG